MASRAINFRAGSGYVTDGAGEGVNVGNSGFNTGSGLTVAWSADLTANARDRSTSVDRRLAGLVFQANNGTTRDFTVTLPDGAGYYEIGLALGDASNAMPDMRCELFDNTTSFALIAGATAAGEFLDAAGVVRTAAAWPGSHVLITRTFASSTLVVRIGKNGTGSTPIAHLYTNKTTPPAADLSGGVTLDNVAPSGTLADGGASSLTGNIILDAVAPSGSLGQQPGAYIVPALTNWNGSLQAGVTVPWISFCRLTDGVQVLVLADQVTDGSGNLSGTNAALLAGTTYMVCGWNADGSSRFARPVVAT